MYESGVAGARTINDLTRASNGRMRMTCSQMAGGCCARVRASRSMVRVQRRVTQVCRTPPQRVTEVRGVPATKGCGCVEGETVCVLVLSNSPLSLLWHLPCAICTACLALVARTWPGLAIFAGCDDTSGLAVVRCAGGDPLLAGRIAGSPSGFWMSLHVGRAGDLQCLTRQQGPGSCEMHGNRVGTGRYLAVNSKAARPRGLARVWQWPSGRGECRDQRENRARSTCSEPRARASGRPRLGRTGAHTRHKVIRKRRPRASGAGGCATAGKRRCAMGRGQWNASR
ncbi:uncharacterized protein C8Q71DRAFT_728905 [Rhodofomes roseus]|uniref:Uncharacterized protein n=1 Tax=Rhodofomes roseus TaxID=34475 RepID=A0ABQ8KWW2_9APHY|nr:uncharacterized protein C8Q71DRAFT_728905 [Rhodofomes roseus]KAH9843549.1 hypothetical protein C8Q71DRAFT_728905 [Rhodofomes roseus]